MKTKQTDRFLPNYLTILSALLLLGMEILADEVIDLNDAFKRKTVYLS